MRAASTWTLPSSGERTCVSVFCGLGPPSDFPHRPTNQNLYTKGDSHPQEQGKEKTYRYRYRRTSVPTIPLHGPNWSEKRRELKRIEVLSRWPSFLAPIKSPCQTPDIFFWAPFPLHQAVKPTSSLIDSTPPGPQRSFPQSQAEVPRGSQDRGPSRPNDLTPSSQRGGSISCILSSCVLRVCVVHRLRSGSMALPPEIRLPPGPPHTQLSGGISKELLYSRTQKPSPPPSPHILLMSERKHPREVARQICPRSRVLPFFIPPVSPLTLPEELSFPAAHSWNFGQSFLRYAVFCILS